MDPTPASSAPTSDLAAMLLALGERARVAARRLSHATTEEKNAALLAVADSLLAAEPDILSANAADLAAAEQRGLSGPLLDRLRLDPARLAAVAQQVRDVAALPDPVGAIQREWTHATNGLRFSKVRVPIGVVGIIYESRPNVTADAAALCLKSGNAAILRGGSEALATNRALAQALRAGLAATALPEDSIQLVDSPDREAVRLLAGMDRHLDVIVPRGGEALIRAVAEHARMPVVKHYTGLCTLYLDRAADPLMAADIAVNAKVSRPGVCNAVETLLVHRDAPRDVLGHVAAALLLRGVELRCDERCRERLGDSAGIVPAHESDWDTEFLDLILAVKMVDSLDDALAHIAAHSSKHSEAIVTNDAATAERFLREVDSAAVYWNASTRFTDGGEFGFGAEIGISTDKLPVRGPMGLEELTTYKYLARGEGQVR